MENWMPLDIGSYMKEFTTETSRETLQSHVDMIKGRHRGDITWILSITTNVELINEITAVESSLSSNRLISDTEMWFGQRSDPDISRVITYIESMESIQPKLIDLERFQTLNSFCATKRWHKPTCIATQTPAPSFGDDKDGAPFLVFTQSQETQKIIDIAAILVSQTKEIIKILLLSILQHGRHNVRWKPAIFDPQQ